MVRVDDVLIVLGVMCLSLAAFLVAIPLGLAVLGAALVAGGVLVGGS